MNCKACATDTTHPTHRPDLVDCIKCHKLKAADHNHVMCRDCERGRGPNR